MESKPFDFELFGIGFTLSIVVSTIITLLCVIVCIFWMTRKLSIRPAHGQTVMELLVDFIKGVVTDNVKWEVAGKPLTIFSTTLFLFIVFSNLLDLPFFVEAGGYSFWNAPTANAVVCLSLSLMVILLSHYLSIQRYGFKRYIKQNYLKPVAFLFPIKILEEFTNTLTLALRLYGNIFAGEVLIALLAQLSLAAGFTTVIPTVMLTIIWQGFSVMVSFIQAYVFTTLSMVYIGHKIEYHEDE
ncbi:MULTISPECIES: F0F1 ATP synthase subunit A [unclassified Granulicatella]|uniref:F0F1 ATP synthase subunit A n=1 Tax=unclassified Granulicatella TaxID=2630493 RepID=UPI0010745EAF|nr:MULTISPECIES: F0F1 ATP synthase subunit A [unclassified Granulicatella]MBF0780859.1 F0F1 ATP synthase subunit A [Granulicatella sp. 19428wC4_WM01]TFU93497.1 F0F1 ATP synthase subunit A [Granulicatella sp. WM01]